MSLFSRKRDSVGVNPGDVFRKVGTYAADWVVERVIDYPDIPQHVRLVDRGTGRVMTVAAAMLQDPEAFKRMAK